MMPPMIEASNSNAPITMSAMAQPGKPSSSVDSCNDDIGSAVVSCDGVGTTALPDVVAGPSPVVTPPVVEAVLVVGGMVVVGTPPDTSTIDASTNPTSSNSSSDCAASSDASTSLPTPSANDNSAMSAVFGLSVSGKTSMRSIGTRNRRASAHSSTASSTSVSTNAISNRASSAPTTAPLGNSGEPEQTASSTESHVRPKKPLSHTHSVPQQFPASHVSAHSGAPRHTPLRH
mmetsp:Transcript_16503/g.28357  ORF Transcript_16503/g.28357 Transcript_16503/m.28357 type:complete len:232 (-) Transcript_16503:1413-2108(-)